MTCSCWIVSSNAPSFPWYGIDPCLVWTPLALPTLEIIRPRLRRGAIVIADNTTMAKPLYKEFLDYLHDPKNGFKTTTMPYSGGLEMAVYLPSD